MVTVAAGKNGLPYALVDGVLLNSGINPVKEAEGFLSAKIGDFPQTLIITGLSLSYIPDILEEKYPKVKKIYIFYNQALVPLRLSKDYSRKQPPVSAFIWSPSAGMALNDFLFSILSELDVEGLKLIEWPPGRKAFPTVAETCDNAIIAVLRRLNGSAVTVANFGKRWIRNIIKNFIFIDNVTMFKPPNKPVVIAASGPSLSDIFPLLKRYRNTCTIWALPSALTMLLAENLKPDVVVATDPGRWAFEHLRPLSQWRDIPILMPLSAAAGLWQIGSCVSFFSQNMFLEQMLYKESGLYPPVIPQNGTVAGTALTAAFLSVNAPIVFAGLDLGKKNGDFHIHPHAFDYFFIQNQNRINPLDSRHYEHYFAISGGFSKALDTYAGWFAGLSEENRPQVYRFSPSNVAIPSFKNVDKVELAGILTGYKPDKSKTSVSFGFLPGSTEDIDGRKRAVYSILQRFIAALPDEKVKHKPLENFHFLFETPELSELFFYADFQGLKKVKKYGADYVFSFLSGIRSFLKSLTEEE